MTNQQGAPEALQPIHRFEVVDCIDSKHVPAVIPNASGPWVRYEDHAAALCRLNAYCQELESQVIRDCMTHVQNPAEIEHVAGDVSKNWAETNMSTQQPAPATQQAGEALSDDLRDRLVAISEAVADQDDRAAQAMLREILKAPQADSQPAPIDMVLHCPTCGLQHIDRPDGVEDGADWNDPEIAWTNPPHRSHLCHGCGHIWRPADVPTNGVKAVKTTGKADSQPAPVLDERKAFEAWFKREYHSRLCRNMPDKSYNDPMANSTWIGWQARAARAPADSVLEDAAWWISTAQAELDGVETDDANNCLKAARGALEKALAAARKQGAKHD